MIRDKLFQHSPYDGFDPTPYPTDMQGWGSDHYLLGEAIRALKPRAICEIGSWKGRSAINMARIVRSLEIETEIVCVDTWLGSPEHWLNRDAAHESLRIHHGMPQLYYTFLSNVVREGLQDIITPFPTTSENAAVVFQGVGARFDMIYLDAAHEYDAALRDLGHYFPLLNEPGLLIGDDYIGWEGVTRAANKFAIDQAIPIIGEGGKFLLPKGIRAKIAIG
jgi:hypothetical protein